jgi:phospholipid N-methyltransferase
MFSLELKESILQNATRYLSDVGQFLQFQYAPFDYKRLKSHFGSVKINFSMRNFPPAFVYRCMLYIQNINYAKKKPLKEWLFLEFINIVTV